MLLPKFQVSGLIHNYTNNNNNGDNDGGGGGDDDDDDNNNNNNNNINGRTHTMPVTSQVRTKTMHENTSGKNSTLTL